MHCPSPYSSSGTFLHIKINNRIILHTSLSSRNSLIKCKSTQNTLESHILHSFWLARGVIDDTDRQHLVDTGIANLNTQTSSLSTPQSLLENNGSLPGVSSTWQPLEGASATHIIDISRRLVALHQLLGGKEDIDIVWMVERSPELLTANFSKITRRLVELRTSKSAIGIDIIKLVEAQPSLLLEEATSSYTTSPKTSLSFSPASGDEIEEEEESVEQQLTSWSHGILSDGASEWAKRVLQLEHYIEVFGDAHVGFRESTDDPGLVRWAKKQRKEKKQGTLSEERKVLLEGLGFEFDPETAEWLRFFTQLKKFREESGHCNPVPLAADSDFLLLNWCAIQRIARRSKVLSEERIALLENLGFDFSGADALS